MSQFMQGRRSLYGVTYVGQLTREGGLPFTYFGLHREVRSYPASNSSTTLPGVSLTIFESSYGVYGLH